MGAIAPACLGDGGTNNKPPATLPAAPTTLDAPTATTARIDLTWVDTSDNEAEFRIERSDDGGTSYFPVSATAKNVQGFSDFGLQPNKTYFYRVASWNAKGYSAFAGPVAKATKALIWSAGSMTDGPGIGKALHSAIYDPLGQRMIVFGGIDDGLTVLNEVWSYDLSGATAGDWSSPATTGTPPLPRYGHSAIFDPLNQRMIVFGGIAEVPGAPPTLVHQNDIHVLNLSTMAWSQPTVGGTPPSPRAFHKAVYDSDNERIIVYGGQDAMLAPLGDVYHLNLSGPMAWSAPGVGARPVGREQHAAIFDPLQHRMIIFAGLDNESVLDGSALANDTWTFSTSGWSQLFFSGTPGFRFGHSAVYDAANQRMLTFGGNESNVPTATSEMWGLKLPGTPSWVLLDPSFGSPPAARSGHSAIYDTGFKRMIIYGGYDDFATAYDEVWIIDL